MWRVNGLVRVTRARNAEHAILLDADTGTQVGPLVVGTRKEIEIGSLTRLVRTGSRFFLVHTHPSDGPFSPTDSLLIFRLQPRLCAMGVVGALGTTYLMSKQPRAAPPSSDALWQAFRDEHDSPARERDMNDVIASRARTSREAKCERVHQTWLAITASHGLRYTRIPAREEA